MSSSSMPKLIDLFEKATSEDIKEPDVGINLEIADMMNSRRRYCLEGIEYFKQLLKSTDLKTIDLTMTLLETCVKNCNVHFHRYVCTRDMMPSIAQLLKRRRKKLNLVEKLAGIYKNPGWRKIEDRVLAMVQLWADTFMMQEDTYPAFMRVYRDLRQDGLKFPPRDPNERFMIKFEGEPSPAFELADMEQPAPKVESRGGEERKRSQQPSIEEVPQLLQSDVDNLKEGLKVLETILCEARDVKELQEPRSKDYIRKCRSGQKKLMWIVSYKTETADEASVMQLIGIMEYVNNKMEAFKKAAGILKRGGSSSEIRLLLKGTEKKSPGDLLDLADDFLEIEEKNQLDGLDKFVQGRETKVEVVREVKKEEVKVVEERKEAVKIEPPKDEVHRRLEQPNLLFDDYQPTPQVIQPTQPVNLLDLNTLQLGPAPVNMMGQPIGSSMGQPMGSSMGQPMGSSMGQPMGSSMGQPMGQPMGQNVYPGNYGQPMYPPQGNMYGTQGYMGQAYNPQQGYNAPPRMKAQPSADDFEDFFADLANRKAL
ncbi:hypothetical protein SteCoe_13844 [Stentor coeruleus]|uniref:VHS domain-containing protein n=1 Tax=Stentor coeruleus TaxID=5963 RepID=A0A1R2C7E6_9CILI|nr:hypothetical protein SteCoe_13844 [Stentor coeruleus]